MEIRRLREQDDRSQFHSADDDLDRFFHRFAGQNQFRHYVGVTYVAAEQGRIFGFVTVVPGHLEGDRLPATLRRKPPSYPLPILRLARLAVDAAAQGQGLGKQLVRFVIDPASKMANDYGCTGIVVDAKPQAVDFYARYGSVELVAVEGASDARPQPKPMFLAMRAITAARPLRTEPQ
jgi:GNAT superfamily N-acetyltransferase